MSLADRYILRNLIGPLMFGVAAFVSILTASKPLIELTNLAFQGVPPGTLLRLFLLALPPMIVLSLPMSVLLATLLGFGRLSGDSEIVAMYAGGLSLYRAAVPAIALGFAVMIITVAFNERVVPWSISSATALKASVEEGVKEQRQFELPQYENGVLARRIYAERFDPKTRVMRHVTVVSWSEGRPNRIIYADKAVYRNDNHWTLYHVEWRELADGHASPLTTLDTQEITVQQSLAEIHEEKKLREKSMAELQAAIGRYREQGIATDELRVAYWNRWAMPFASVVFALIGLPLGVRPQRTSSGLGLGLSIVIIFLYYVLWSFSSRFGAGLVPAFLASWCANLLGLAVGGYLIARAPK